MDSLRGKLLIASPALVDPNFHRTVILIAEHTDEGAMGLVLNRPAETLVAEAVPDLSELADDGAPVYVGGPVAADSVIVLAEFDEPVARRRAARRRPRLRRQRRRATSPTSPAACAARASSPATPAGARASSRASSRRSRGSSSRRAARRSSARTRSAVGGGAAAQGPRVRAALDDAAGPVRQLARPRVRITPRGLTGLPRRTGPGRRGVCRPCPQTPTTSTTSSPPIPEGMTLGEYRRARMNRQPKPVRKGPRWFPHAARARRLRLDSPAAGAVTAPAAVNSVLPSGRRTIAMRDPARRGPRSVLVLLEPVVALELDASRSSAPIAASTSGPSSRARCRPRSPPRPRASPARWCRRRRRPSRTASTSTSRSPSTSP